ncbi:DUF3322 domain-containing protein [Mangrovibacterium sp.]|uniref:DUF3322 domain-containing protein n=1 Tax=Mangrovibacterium sp. TaxID=1961364 RepID=UPI00356872F1
MPCRLQKKVKKLPQIPRNNRNVNQHHDELQHKPGFKRHAVGCKRYRWRQLGRSKINHRTVFATPERAIGIIG